jgi:hypothetical protein
MKALKGFTKLKEMVDHKKRSNPIDLVCLRTKVLLDLDLKRCAI